MVLQSIIVDTVATYAIASVKGAKGHTSSSKPKAIFGTRHVHGVVTEPRGKELARLRQRQANAV